MKKTISLLCISTLGGTLMAQSVTTNVPEQNTQQSVQPQLAQQTQPEQPQTPEEKNLQLLYQKNPFGQSTNVALQQQGSATTMTSPQGLELRSIYCVDKVWYFCVYDTAQDKSYRLKLGQPYTEAIPYAIEFYDDETNSVSITSPMGSYTITLKERDQLTGKPVVGTSAKKTTKTKTNTLTKAKAKR